MEKRPPLVPLHLSSLVSIREGPVTKLWLPGSAMRKRSQREVFSGRGGGTTSVENLLFKSDHTSSSFFEDFIYLFERERARVG